MEQAVKLRGICGNQSLFWDEQLMWNTTSPQFTKCFQSTVVAFIPCAFAWIFLPLKIYSFRKSKTRNLPWSILNIAKLAINVLLSILFISKLFFVNNEENDLAYLDVIGCVFQASTFLLTTLIIYYERKYGIRSSLYMFCHNLTWTIVGIFVSIHYSSRPDELETAKGVSNFIIFSIYFPLIIAQMILSMIADVKPKYAKQSQFKNANPSESASFLSQLMLAWFDKLLWKGFRTELKCEDIWDPVSSVKTKFSIPKCTEAISQSSSVKKRLSCARIIWKMYWPRLTLVTFMFILSDVCLYMNPVILREFFRFVATDEPFWHGYVHVVGLLLSFQGASVFFWQAWFLSQTIGCSIRTAFTSLIYRKSLTLNSSYKQKTTTGEMINLMSVDVHRVVEFVDDALYSVIFPLQITVGFCMLYNLVGAAAFSGLAVMVLLKIVSAYLANKQETLETLQLKLKDERIRNLSEAISGVKVLKFFAWENSFMSRIAQLRRKETQAIKKCLVLEGITNLIWGISPLMMNTAMFATYILMDSNNVLDVEKIFITVSVIGLLQIPMFRLPMAISGFIQARVSVARLNSYLNGKDLEEGSVTKTLDITSNDVITVKDASFSWSSEETEKLLTDSFNFNLDNINMKINRGDLVAVVGSVGSGKSSLLSALLGEMDKKSGTVAINGRIAYVSQQAWIQNATVKENILFGKPLNKERYDSAIQCCDLEPDLAVMAGRDEAEIGEKGINLSGGQKQRISLARAVYDDADVYLLDDPLSAVDPQVGAHIFNRIIGPQGVLKLKTRVLVTHSLTHLPSMDHIIVLDNGEITEAGSYKELMERNNAFAHYLKTYRLEESSSMPKFTRSESVKSDTLSEIYKSNVNLDEGQLTMEEFRAKGKVNYSVYRSYLSYVGCPLIVAAIVVAVIAFIFSATTEIWLSHWSMDAEQITYELSHNDSTSAHHSNFTRLGVYGTLSLFFGLFSGFYTLIVVTGAMKACITYHKKLLYSVLRSPMSFFDTTPSGRIVNRFSKDIEMVDTNVPFSFHNILWAVMQILEALVVICFKVPVFITVTVPLFVIYYLIQVFFIRTIDQLRRLESTTRSPVYSRFSETLAGSSTLRAFRKESQFIQLFDQLIDDNMKILFNIKILFVWIGVRLDLLGNLFIVLTALFGLLYKDSLDAGTIALIVNYAFSVSLTFMWLVENAGQLESNIVSVERLHEYIALPSEASWESKDKTVEWDWPKNGEITFSDYSTKYRSELAPVLKRLNFTINPGEKIGLIGRTGAGKSSVALALFRMMEATEGKVVIDGVPIGEIGLHDLRSRLTIIPQDPVLFSGLLRLNLDPYNHYSDDQLWKALELAHLKDFVASSSAGLNQEIAEGGSNLSVGQKQLVCLARALLKKTKILVLDEATAAVDSQTDALIQSTIRSEFSDCTILTIAHRLNTIMDCNRLIVFNEGKVKAFDKPEKLMELIKSSLDENAEKK